MFHIRSPQFQKGYYGWGQKTLYLHIISSFLEPHTPTEESAYSLRPLKAGCPGPEVPIFLISLTPLMDKDQSLKCLSGGILPSPHKKYVFINNL